MANFNCVTPDVLLPIILAIVLSEHIIFALALM